MTHDKFSDQVGDPAMTAAREIDALVQNWRRRAAKREVGHAALKDLGIALDLPQLDVLMAIAGPEPEFAVAEGDETMVSTVASRLGIDPSRASRLVAEMVQTGYTERAVSQSDSRRTILVLTPMGSAVVEAVRSYKLMMMREFLSEWDPKELQTFLPLLRRFSEWSDNIDSRRRTFAERISMLARTVSDTGGDKGSRSA